MSLLDTVQVHITEAMKAKDDLKLNTLRSIKAALDRYRVDQQKPIDEKIEQNILNTLAKQRLEAAEAFHKGERTALALKEEAEHAIIKAYMLIDATEQEIEAAVNALFDVDNPSPHFEHVKPAMKQMGLFIKAAQERLTGKRVDGKILSEKVKAKLT
jgi:uncharacterized protein